MKNQDRKKEEEIVTIQDARIKFIEKLSEAIGVALQDGAGLIMPINILISFLERKGVHFLKQISTKVIIEFRVIIFMHYSKTDCEVIVTGVKSYLYLCASKKWIDVDVLHAWEALSKESFITNGTPDIGMN